ncbi:MAG: XrtA/PEP-CTERM system histidine kinase PrsK [Nitrospinota bacterium]
MPFNYFFSTLFFFLSLLLLVVFFFTSSIRRKAQLFINRHFYKHKYEFRDSWMESIENISPKRTEDDIKKTLMKMIIDKMGAKSFHMWLYDPVSRSYYSSDNNILEGLSRIASNHPLIKVIKERMNPFLIRDVIKNEPEGSDGKLADIVNSTQSVLCSPLVAGHDIVGFILQGEDLSGEPYGDDDFQLLKALTTQAAVQIRNIRLAQDLIATKEVDVFSKMSSFIMHDLKNLTNSLSLLSQNARQNMDNPEFQKDAMDTIDRTITRMKRLIEKLSTVRKGVELNMEPVELSQLINNALAKLAPSEKKNVIITKKIDDLPLVSVDRESIEMVVLNIITNAYDAIQKAGKIEIKALLNGKNINIKISDTGVGMSDNFVEHSLFRPFKSTKSLGFGIGLYQSKDLVEAHGGRIDVESIQGKGTTFTIILPVNMADGAE